MDLFCIVLAYSYFGFAEDTVARPLDFSRLYFSLKNKNKWIYFVLFSLIRTLASPKILPLDIKNK